MRRIWIFLILIIGFVLYGCNDSEPTAPDASEATGEMTSSSGCKYSASDYGASQECMQISYDGYGTLRVLHINAGHNCDAEASAATVTVENGQITIIESLGGMADCRCLFDLEYTVSLVSPGVYTIIIQGGLGNPIGSLTLDLTREHFAEKCVYQSGYPWD